MYIVKWFALLSWVLFVAAMANGLSHTASPAYVAPYPTPWETRIAAPLLFVWWPLIVGYLVAWQKEPRETSEIWYVAYFAILIAVLITYFFATTPYLGGYTDSDELSVRATAFWLGAEFLLFVGGTQINKQTFTRLVGGG